MPACPLPTPWPTPQSHACLSTVTCALAFASNTRGRSSPHWRPGAQLHTRTLIPRATYPHHPRAGSCKGARGRSGKRKGRGIRQRQVGRAAGRRAGSNEGEACT
eukprot:366356-Chlamydomonas_euryale.AAC.1